MMTRPQSRRGAKSAERAPTTTWASPWRTMSHWSKRSPVERRECRTATSSPKRERKRPTVWAVSEISGTRTRAPLPWARTRSMASRYTSVLPEPVTPSTRTTSPRPARTASSMAASAASWPAVRRSGRTAFALERVVVSPPRTRRRCETATTPRLTNAFTTPVTPDIMAESSAMRTGPAERASMRARWRLAVLAGSKSAAAGVSSTQRSSTAVACSHTSCQGASSDSRRTRMDCPGATNRRRHSERGAAYSSAIQAASWAARSSNAGVARTRSMGRTLEGSRPSGVSSVTATT